MEIQYNSRQLFALPKDLNPIYDCDVFKAYLIDEESERQESTNYTVDLSDYDIRLRFKTKVGHVNDGSELGGDGYHPLMDFNHNGEIDIFDVVILVWAFGVRYS